MEKKIEELNGFKDLRIVDNFYQTSSFFPMPTTEIGTLSESGLTNLGSYSLCFPYYIAGKDYYAMILCCRNSSNTAKNILRTGKCTINFITDKRKYFKEAVRLGYPGETTEEKMKDCIFNLVDGKRARENPNEQYPKIIQEAFQVFECTWVRELDGAENDKVQDEYLPPYHQFNGITSQFGAHFILKIDNILMKPIDEVPLGIMIDKGVKSIGKSIKKEDPEEKMGVFCKKNGKVGVIEYSEISKELAKKKKGNELLYADAHLLWNIYRVDDLEKISMKKVKYHLAYKKCNYMNKNGELVVPNKLNAYKFESFIFDFFDILNDMIIYRVDRYKEYAPIKNNVGIDSLESAREKYKKC